MNLKSLCVFCGSRTGADPFYGNTAREFGTRIARSGLTLVYGGGNVGLMGIMADAALEAGGRVVGVIPEQLVQREEAHQAISELHVVDMMHERKALMAELADNDGISMEGIIFIGIQDSGKTSFYHQEFHRTHIRLSMDMLKTRHREMLLLDACIAARQPVVIDNTNITRAARAPYIAAFKRGGFEVNGYFFRADPTECLERNRRRPGKQKIAAAGVLGTFKRLEIPTFSEGFDRIYQVSIRAEGFDVEEWDKSS